MKFFKVKNFRGGVHPPDQKERTKDKPIEEAPIPDRVILPLRQKSGKGATPLVSKGDKVLTGQKIGEADDLFAANVHSSVSGKVLKLVEFPHPQGFNSLSVIIESDGEDKWVDNLKVYDDLKNLSPHQIVEAVREAGIVGLGGAEFPTAVKLTPPQEKKVEFVILNGAECEPYLTSDHRLMLEKSEEIIQGLKLIMKTVSAQKGFIGIEQNKPDAIEVMKKAAMGTGIEVCTLPVKYPQGGEKLLIKAILNREVSSGALPMDVGALIQNVGTAFSIYEAVKFGKPLIKRVITVTGPAISNPKNLLVRIGTSFDFLINLCGGFSGEAEQVIMGGPMMGVAQFTLEVPVIKGTSGIVATLKKGNKKRESGPCIRCGRCITSCPLGLSPSLFGLYGERGLIDNAEAIGIKECMECGICSYVCPSGRPVTQLIKSVKSELMNKKSRKKRS